MNEESNPSHDGDGHELQSRIAQLEEEVRKLREVIRQIATDEIERKGQKK
jgi:hypothetical protein